MKVIVQNQDRTASINEWVNQHRNTLRDQGKLVLNTLDHCSHIGAYLAWLDTPGKIFVKSPLLSARDQIGYDQQTLAYDHIDDGLFFHTSGTTGSPKIIHHGRQQMSMIETMSQHTFQWEAQSRLLCMVPASVSAFWHIIMPNLCKTGFTVYVGDRETLVNDLRTIDFDLSLSSPNFPDFLRSTGVKLDFSKFRLMLLGGSQFLPRHSDFLFSNGAKCVIHGYGQTETGSPLLSRRLEKDQDFTDYLDITAVVSGVECRIVDQELWVRSPSNCVNFRQFAHYEDWLRTGDLWEQHDNLIKFVGRRDDLRKINGYFANLLDIENWFEDVADLGDCSVHIRNISGTDYVELIHTKPMLQTKIDLQRQAAEVFARCCVPVKFSQVQSIQRNALGKKLRTVDRSEP